MSYPGTINSLTEKTDGPDQIIYAAHMNAIRTALLDVVTTLGNAPQGNLSSVEARLDVLINDDGKLKPQTQLLFVGKSGCQYSTIQSAIDAISDAASGKIYTIMVFPGTYAESITLKGYVYLVGLDRNACKISPPDTSSAIDGTGSFGISNFSIIGNADAHTIVRSANGTTQLFNCIVSATDVKYCFYLTDGSIELRNCSVAGECEAVVSTGDNFNAFYSTFQESSGTNCIEATGGNLRLYHCNAESGGGHSVVITSPAVGVICGCILDEAPTGTGTIYTGAMSDSNAVESHI